MQPAFAPRQVALVGDEPVAALAQGGFHDRVPSALDDEGEGIVDARARPVALARKLRERGRHVERAKRVGRAFDGVRLRLHAGGQIVEDLALDGERAVRRRGDARFQLRQLGGGEAHRVGHRLPVNEMRVEGRLQQLLALRLRRFDEPAQKIVVLDLQLLRFGKLAVARLKRGDDAARLVAQRARFIERGVEARAHEAAVAPLQRQLVGERAGEGLLEACVDGGDVARAVRRFRPAGRRPRQVPRRSPRRLNIRREWRRDRAALRVPAQCAPARAPCPAPPSSACEAARAIAARR